jgi:phosphatidate cytidylyltransferase
MNNLAQRVITGIIGVVIMISGIAYHEITFGLIFIIISFLTVQEFYTLTSKNGYYPFKTWGLLFSTVLFCLIFLSVSGIIEYKFLWLLLPLFTFAFIIPLYSKKEAHPINCLSVTLMGVFYIALPFSLLSIIAFKNGGFEFQVILGLLIAQWASDTGAYFVGKTFGRTKLFERVSPNKTWEGTIGGIILAVGALYLWSQYFEILTSIQWIGLGLIVSIFGSFGDLIESLFKRTFQLKDSGTVLKGHGGFLDRFDGFIVAIPFATAYFMFIT